MDDYKLFTSVLNYFLNLAECKHLHLCKIDIGIEQGEVCLIIDCPDLATANQVWAQRNLLTLSASLLGLHKRLILKIKGSFFGAASSQLEVSSRCKNMILPAKPYSGIGYQYTDLLLLVAQSQYPTFIAEIPKGWHWGQPQYCILTSSQVTSFSGKLAPKLHGYDLTLLYDRPVFEGIMKTLTDEFQKSGKSRITIKNYQYRSYTFDKSRQSLSRDEEQEYNSDFELMYLQDLDTLVRICYCKERRPMN